MGTPGNNSSPKLAWSFVIVLLLVGIAQLVLNTMYNTSGSPLSLILFNASLTVIGLALSLFQSFSGGAQSFIDSLRLPRHTAFLRQKALLLGLSGLLAISLFFNFYPLLAKQHGGVTSSKTSPTPTPVPSSPFLVQSSFNASMESTNTVQFTQKPVRQGDVILVAITQFERGEVLDLKDSQGDTSQKVGGDIANPVNQQDYVELYYFQNVKGGAKTSVTVTFGLFTDQGGGSTNVGIYEYAGLSTTSPELDSDTATSNGKKTMSILLNRTLMTSDHGVCFAVGVDSGPDNNGVPYDHAISSGGQYALLYPHTPEERSLDDANTRERFFTEAASVSSGGCIPNFLHC